jgi:hypothetical protein
MRMKRTLPFAAVLSLCVFACAAAAEPATQPATQPVAAPLTQPSPPKGVPAHLQRVSATVKTGDGQGSAVLFVREIDGKPVTFAWTAGHCVEGLRKTREIIDAKGGKRQVVEYPDVQIVQELIENGRCVGEVKFDAQVVKVSDSNDGEDLALLRVHKTGFAAESARFYLDGQIPEVGSDLFHCGSMLGQMGSNSITTGVLSQIGRMLGKKELDQVSAPARPGSSGGGVYLRDGRCVGSWFGVPAAGTP